MNTASAHLAPDEAQSAFRLTSLPERLALLRALCDHTTPLALTLPDGSTVPSVVWAVEPQHRRLHLSAQAEPHRIDRLLQFDEALAVGTLDSVRVQFDLSGLTLVQGQDGLRVLQATLPESVFRFQRREHFRVAASGRHGPQLRLRHPALPDMQMLLRVVDLSLGGCAFWLPPDLPALEPGTRIGELMLELDADTRIAASATLQHVTALSQGDTPGPMGQKVGCAFSDLSPHALRMLQRWIDRAQLRMRRPPADAHGASA